MNLRSEAIKTFAFTYRNLTTIRRNIFQLAEIFFVPFITILSVGFMLAYLKPDLKSAAVVMSGVAALSVLQTCQLDVAYVLLFDMWSKSLKHTLAAPIGARHYLIGSWLVGIVRGTVTMAIIVLFIRWAFGFDFFVVGWFVTFKFWAGLMVSGFMIGMLTTVALYTFGWRAEIVPWTIVSVLLVLCGVYYPISVLPAWVQSVSRMVPLTLFLESYRSAFGVPGTPHASLRGFALCIVYFAVIYGMLVLAQKRARRRGIIVKLSE